MKTKSNLITTLILSIAVAILLVGGVNLYEENQQLKEKVEVAQQENSDLQYELTETKERLLISNDQLRMIEMRNEGIGYQEDAE